MSKNIENDHTSPSFRQLQEIKKTLMDLVPRITSLELKMDQLDKTMQVSRQTLQHPELNRPQSRQLIKESQIQEDMSRRQQFTKRRRRKIEQSKLSFESDESAEQSLIDEIHLLRLKLNEKQDLLRQQNQLLRQQEEEQIHTLSRHVKEHGQFNNQPTSPHNVSSDDEVERMKLCKERLRKKINSNALKKSTEYYESFNQKHDKIQLQSSLATTFDEHKRLAEDQIINLFEYQIKTKALHKERNEKLARMSDTQTHLE